MNYAFSLSNGSYSCHNLQPYRRYKIMRFFITDVGFEPVWMWRRRPALHSTAPLQTALDKWFLISYIQHCQVCNVSIMETSCLWLNKVYTSQNLHSWNIKVRITTMRHSVIVKCGTQSICCSETKYFIFGTNIG